MRIAVRFSGWRFRMYCFKVYGLSWNERGGRGAKFYLLNKASIIKPMQINKMILIATQTYTL